MPVTAEIERYESLARDVRALIGRRPGNVGHLLHAHANLQLRELAVWRRYAGDLALVVIEALYLLTVSGLDLGGIDDFTGTIHSGRSVARSCRRRGRGAVGARGGIAAGLCTSDHGKGNHQYKGTDFCEHVATLPIHFLICLRDIVLLNSCKSTALHMQRASGGLAVLRLHPGWPSCDVPAPHHAFEGRGRRRGDLAAYRPVTQLRVAREQRLRA